MRRGQISMFVIIGILLLFSVLFTVALYQDWAIFRPPETQVTCEVPTELLPLENAVRQCQTQLSREAAQQVLINGGYVNAEQFGLFSTISPQGNSVDVGDGTLIPYWNYIDGSSQASMQPALQEYTSASVARQVADILDEQLESCVPWAEFDQYEIERGEPTSLVSFDSTQTIIQTRWEMEVDVEQCADKDYVLFETRYESPVTALYDQMEAIMDTLANSRQIETATMQWLGIFSGADNDLPPLDEGVSMGGNIEIYPLSEARGEIREVISYTTSSLVLEGSPGASIVLSGNDAISGTILAGIIPNPLPYSDITMSASSPPMYEPYLAVNGNPGVAMPQITSVGGLLSAMLPNLIDNSYFYDLSFPVIFTIEKDGVVLRAAYEANIQGNEPAQALEMASESQIYCQSAGGTTASITVEPEGVEHQIFYKCGSATCPLGSAEQGPLVVDLPSCAQGSIEAVAEGLYSEPADAASVAGGGQIDVDLRLLEPQPVQVRVQKRELTPQLNGDYTLGTAVATNAEVIMIREDIPFFAQPDENGMTELVPGRYRVMIFEQQEFDPPHIIPPWIITDVSPPEIVEGTTIEVLPSVYLEMNEDDPLIIEQVPNELIIEAVGLPILFTADGPRPVGLDSYEDFGLLGAMFEIAETSQKVLVQEAPGVQRLRLVEAEAEN